MIPANGPPAIITRIVQGMHFYLRLIVDKTESIEFGNNQLAFSAAEPFIIHQNRNARLRFNTGKLPTSKVTRVILLNFHWLGHVLQNLPHALKQGEFMHVCLCHAPSASANLFRTDWVMHGRKAHLCSPRLDTYFDWLSLACLLQKSTFGF